MSWVEKGDCARDVGAMEVEMMMIAMAMAIEVLMVVMEE